jgi:hypothetical protein
MSARRPRSRSVITADVLGIGSVTAGIPPTLSVLESDLTKVQAVVEMVLGAPTATVVVVVVLKAPKETVAEMHLRAPKETVAETRLRAPKETFVETHLKAPKVTVVGMEIGARTETKKNVSPRDTHLAATLLSDDRPHLRENNNLLRSHHPRNTNAIRRSSIK